MAKVEIQKVTRENLGSYINDLHVLMEDFDKDSFDSQIGKRLEVVIHSESKSRLLVAIHKGKVVGTAGLYAIQHPLRTDWIVEDVTRLPEARGIGVGPQLMNALIDEAKDLSKQYGREILVFLTSNPKRKRANELYQELGFKLAAAAVRNEKGDPVSGATNLYKLNVSSD